MIDLKKFKKVSSDKHTTTLKHDDGHEFKVVHSVLSPKLRKDIEKLPHYAKGEMVEGERNPDDTYGTPIQAEYSDKPAELPPPIVPQESETFTPGNVGATVNEATKAPAPEDNSAFPAGHVGESIDKAVESEPLVKAEGTAQPDNPLLTRLNQITQPDPAMAGQVQGAIQSNINRNDQIAQNFAQNKAKIDAEHQALVHDIMNNHINMSDYWKQNDKGAAALGALLGGMGSGLTGLANPVPGMIANSQENFLKAELANMENPKSLLSAVQAQYGNNQNAADVMRIISNEALNANLQKVMAPLNSATAQANAAQVQMQLMQNTESLKQQIAMRQALQQGASSGDPHQRLLLMQRTGMIDKEDAKTATQELGSIDQANSLRGNLVNSFKDLDRKVLAGKLSPNDRASAINAFAGQLEHIAEGRFNFAEAQTQMDAIMPKALDSAETRQKKFQRLHMLIDGLLKTPTLEKYGLRTKLDVQPR